MAFLGLGTLLILRATAQHATKPAQTNLVQENTQKNISPSPVPTDIPNTPTPTDVPPERD